MSLTTMVAAVMMIVCAGTINAQDKFVTFGVKGGANLSSYSGDINDTKYVFKCQFGAIVDLAFTDHLYIVTGLDFQTKGTKVEPKKGKDIKYNPMYLQIPVHAAYKFDIAPRTRFVVEAGPYISYGIGGKMKGNEKVNIFGDDRLNRFDFGLGAGIGLEYQHVAIKGGYDFGLIDISDVNKVKVKVKNQNAYLTLGYRF